MRCEEDGRTGPVDEGRNENIVPWRNRLDLSHVKGECESMRAQNLQETQRKKASMREKRSSDSTTRVVDDAVAFILLMSLSREDGPRQAVPRRDLILPMLLAMSAYRLLFWVDRGRRARSIASKEGPMSP